MDGRLMIGQGSPTLLDLPRAHSPARRRAALLRLGLLVAACIGTRAPCRAEPVSVRLRFAWGSGTQSPQKWLGRISAAGATLSELRPLGIEPDEAAALRLVDGQVAIAPLVRRTFDGCDVNIAGEDSAK